MLQNRQTRHGAESYLLEVKTMKNLIVKKVFRGNGKRTGGLSVGWYANPNNPEAVNIKKGCFYDTRSAARRHIYDKRTIKQIFKDYILVFED